MTEKLKEIDMQFIIDQNFRLLHLLGYSSSIIYDYMKGVQQDETMVTKIEWLMKSIENVVYRNQPCEPLI